MAEKVVSATQHNLSMAIAIFVMLFAFFIAFQIREEANAKLTAAGNKEFALRVAYEDATAKCGSGCVLMENYQPLGLKWKKPRNSLGLSPQEKLDGTPATSKQFLDFLLNNEVQTSLDSWTVDFDGYNYTFSPPHADWSKVG